MVKTNCFYKKENRLTFEQGDMIALIDERPDLNFIKGQNQRTFEIGTFPRYVCIFKIKSFLIFFNNFFYSLTFRKMVDITTFANNEKDKSKTSTISRPLTESFRHTAHCSPFGSSWGSPSFLRPLSLTDSLRGKVMLLYLTNIIKINKILSGNTLDSTRQKKKTIHTSTELYVRERKSNATKQFAYNKLKSDKPHESLTSLSTTVASTTKSKPSRPPQPTFSNGETEKEGMLIDLTSTNEPELFSSHATNNSNMQISSLLNVSLLDAPIDVPTIDDIKLEPPPYQSPPTYINTLSLTENYNYCGASSQRMAQQNPSTSIDPLDISSRLTHLTTHHGVEETIMALPPSQPKPMTNQLDSLVTSTMASFCPQNSMQNLTPLVSSRAKSNSSSNRSSVSLYKSPLNISPRPSTSDLTLPEIDLETSSSELSDSLKVNMSSLSLDNSGCGGGSVNSSRNATKKLDKAFYADLEKEIYKNELSAASLMANTSQTYARSIASKESSVSMMPIEIYDRRQPSMTVTSESTNLSKVENGSLPRLPKASQSPSTSDKYANTMTKSVNQEIAAASRANYETASAGASSSYSAQALPYNIQKLNNADASASTATVTTIPTHSTDSTNTILTQNWFDQKEIPKMKPAEKNHNFVAISNRPTSTMNPTSIKNATRTNIYNSVTRDVYGSVSGDGLYETIGTPTIYGATPAIYGNTRPSLAPVLYDEVASEDLLRPHRPAPVVPGLSAQQIQRRMERELQQQQQVYENVPETQMIAALLRELGDDEATEAEAMQALAAANWEHAAGVRQFKIERLLRLVALLFLQNKSLFFKLI